MADGRNWLRLLGQVVLAIGACTVSAFAHAEDVARTVFVPRSVIYPGDVITADALVEGRFVRRSDSPAVFGETAGDLVGKVARRTLMRGELVPSSAVHEQDLVKQGRPYKLTYSSATLSIVGVGVPMQSAAVGEMVNVRNPDTGVIIKARVQADQTLTVEEQ